MTLIPSNFDYPQRRPYPGDHMLDTVHKLALLGLNDQQMADVLCEGDLEAFTEWRQIYRNLDSEIHRGRVLADAEVAAALYKRARGFDHTELRNRYFIDKDGNEKLTGYEKREIYVPPDVKAIELWLKTRQHELWPVKQPEQIELDRTKPEANANDVGQELLRRVEAVLTRAADQVKGADTKPDTSNPEDPEGPVE